MDVDRLAYQNVPKDNDRDKRVNFVLATSSRALAMEHSFLERLHLMQNVVLELFMTYTRSLFSVLCSLFSVLCSLFSVLCSLFSFRCSYSTLCRGLYRIYSYVFTNANYK